jgi:hypothetical protein
VCSASPVKRQVLHDQQPEDQEGDPCPWVKTYAFIFIYLFFCGAGA